MSPDDRPDLRRALLRAFYLRRAAGLSVVFLATTLSRQTGVLTTREEVAEELQFLIRKGLVETADDDLGSAKYHSLTPDGILYCERNDLAD